MTLSANSRPPGGPPRTCGSGLPGISVGAAESGTWSIAPRTSCGFRRAPAALIGAAVLSPFAALTTGFVQKALVAIVVLDIPLQIGTHFYYREDDASLGALGGLGISITTIALAALYLSWCFRALAAGRRAGREVYFNVALTTYLAIAALSTLFAQNGSLALFELFLFFESYLVYVYVSNAI